jgi:hypothetical protein
LKRAPRQKSRPRANPGFRKTLFPSADPADEIMAAMKGKRLPLIGRVEISIVEEAIRGS